MHRVLRSVQGWHMLNLQDCGSSQRRHLSHKLLLEKASASLRQKTVMTAGGSSVGPSHHCISTNTLNLLSGKKEHSLDPHSTQGCWLLKQEVLKTQAVFNVVVFSTGKHHYNGKKNIN